MTVILLYLSLCVAFNHDFRMHKIPLAYKIWKKVMFCFLQWALAITVGTWHCKIFFFECGFQCSEQKMEDCLDIRKKIQFVLNISAICREGSLTPFLQFNCLQQKTRNLFFSKIFYEDLTTYLPFIMHSILHKLSSFAFPCQQFHKLLQPLRELRTLHSRYQEICLKSVSVTIVNLQVTTYEQ